MCGFTQRLVLTQRQKATQKWPIDDFFFYLSQLCNMLVFSSLDIFSISNLSMTGIVTGFLLLPTEASRRFHGVIFLSNLYFQLVHL